MHCSLQNTNLLCNLHRLHMPLPADLRILVLLGRLSGQLWTVLIASQLCHPVLSSKSLFIHMPNTFLQREFKAGLDGSTTA